MPIRLSFHPSVAPRRLHLLVDVSKQMSLKDSHARIALVLEETGVKSCIRNVLVVRPSEFLLNPSLVLGRSYSRRKSLLPTLVLYFPPNTVLCGPLALHEESFGACHSQNSSPLPLGPESLPKCTKLFPPTPLKLYVLSIY